MPPTPTAAGLFVRAFLALLCFLAFSSARAELIAYETFDSYATGAALHQKTGGYGWANEWYVGSPATATVNGTALTYTFPGSTVQVGGGKSVKITGNSASALRRNIPPKVAGQTLYVSFLAQLRGGTFGGEVGSNVSSGWQALDNEAAATDTIGEIGYAGKVRARVNGNAVLSTPLADGTTYFVTIKYHGWNNSRYKSATVWLNPALGSETSTYNNGRKISYTASTTNNDGSFGFLGLVVGTTFANTNLFQLVDEVRIGTTWNDVVSAAPATTEDGAHPPLVVFGDSLSSGGNNGVLSTGPTPSPAAGVGAYPCQTWIQQLSPAAGYGVLHKSDIPGGTNYAVGGHTTTQMATQVTQYLNSRGGIAEPGALYVLWCGPNDLSQAAQSNPLKFSDPAGFATEIRLRMKTQIERLINAGRSTGNGARTLVWAQMPDVTKTPGLSAYPSAVRDLIRPVVTAFNNGMSASITSLESTYPGVRIHLMPANDWLNSFINSPATYHFSNVVDPSLTSNGHLFYDDMHPTAHGHYEFAMKALTFFQQNGLLAD